VPETIIITVNGASLAVPAGVTVAAALALAIAARQDARAPKVAAPATRRSVTGQLRAPLCGMGVCQECRVTVDGRAHTLACQTVCRAGMRIEAAQ